MLGHMRKDTGVMMSDVEIIVQLIVQQKEKWIVIKYLNKNVIFKLKVS